MEIQKELITLAQRINAQAQNGLVYSDNNYDTDRYEDLLDISHSIIALLTNNELKKVTESCLVEKEYVTPKVDIRAVTFNEKNQILLVKEKADGFWSIPGGWADIGFSPSEIAIKEVKEETGLDVKAIKLLAILDKKKHNHPPALHYVYKIFIQCEIIGGDLRTAFDILDVGFFSKDEIPELSEERVTKEQIDLMFEYRINSQKHAIVD